MEISLVSNFGILNKITQPADVAAAKIPKRQVFDKLLNPPDGHHSIDHMAPKLWAIDHANDGFCMSLLKQKKLITYHFLFLKYTITRYIGT